VLGPVRVTYHGVDRRSNNRTRRPGSLGMCSHSRAPFSGCAARGFFVCLEKHVCPQHCLVCKHCLHVCIWSSSLPAVFYQNTYWTLPLTDTHTCMHTQVRVCGQILSMQDSYIIWVGTAKPSFANLDVAMCSNMDSMPITSTLLGNTTEGFPLSRSLRTQTVVWGHIYIVVWGSMSKST
jgi:hypothetical protein